MNLDRIGKYRVVGLIGKGAMGEVYKAQDPLLNRFVAIKTIAPSLAAEPDFRLRFQREAQSAARLNHPNIVTVFDFGEEDGLIYMAMELLEGRDLRELIRSRAIRAGDKLGIMEQLCDGVGFAHAKGVVHRDLKPGNIHVQPKGQVKILDFGLARLGDSDITRTGTVMGTPHYMSPEQIRGQKVDARSDVFSLGAVFYELLTYHRPFEADSAHDVRFQIAEQPPEPLRRWAPDTPASLVEVLEKALAKEPADRFADAGEMGRALAVARDAIEGETLGGRGRDDGDRTLMPGGDATVVQPSEPPTAYGGVRGATALTPARAHAGAGHQPRTVRPEATVGGGPDTELRRASGLGRWLVLGGAAVVAIAAGAGVLWLRSRGPAPATPLPGPPPAGAIANVVVANQVELAKADLADRDYASATRRAQDALKLDPGSAEARQVLERAGEAQSQIDATVAEARDAFGRGDLSAASLALGRVMVLDPRQPVIGELSASLKKHLRPQAEDGRREAERARRAAEGARATGLPGFAQGHKLDAEADGLFRRQEYAASAQRYLESRDAYERAKREAEAAAAAAARPAPPSLPPPAVAQATPFPVVPTVVPAPTVSPTVVIVSSPTPVAAPAQPSTAAAPTSAIPRPGASEAEIQRVVSDYARALESRDLVLYRTVMPGLRPEDESRLREAFKTYKPQRVGITVDSLQVEGDRASVRATRQDVIDGRPTRAVTQTFQLVRVGAAWQIQAIGR